MSTTFDIFCSWWEGERETNGIFFSFCATLADEVETFFLFTLSILWKCWVALAKNNMKTNKHIDLYASTKHTLLASWHFFLVPISILIFSYVTKKGFQAKYTQFLCSFQHSVFSPSFSLRSLHMLYRITCCVYFHYIHIFFRRCLRVRRDERTKTIRILHFFLI